tara:strand:- start:344 stop:964 length:621 start_codon:yes stop_codon:yes gene_type:complete
MTSTKFIVFEGNEGTGKSTHIRSVSEYLKEINVDHIVTREPGGTEFGESVREVLLNQNSDLDPLSEAMLFYSSRIFNYNHIILKALNEGKLVICDRFHYSTLVYQGLAVKNKQVIELHNVLNEYFSRKISLIIHLDASIKTCLSRISSRKVSDKFEKQGEDFLIKVKDSYIKAFKDNEKVATIMTDNDKSVVWKNIKKQIDSLLND